MIINWIEALKYFFLGLIQGITEVLPISSSGHVELFKALLNLHTDEGLLFLILVNAGSLLTFILIYFKRLVRLVVDFFLYIFKKSTRDVTGKQFFYVVKIIIASIPAGFVGIVFGSQIDKLLTDYGVLLSGIGLLFTGTVLFYLSTNRVRRGKTDITYLDAALVGIAQSVALLPGISRSGMTAGTAIKRGVGIDSALDFSFLIYIPASVGSILISLKKMISQGQSVPGSEYYFYYFIAFVAAAVATYFAFRIIFNIFKTGKLKYFGYYCLGIGILSIVIYIAQFSY